MRMKLAKFPEAESGKNQHFKALKISTEKSIKGRTEEEEGLQRDTTCKSSRSMRKRSITEICKNNFQRGVA